jgi:hypothetical protein
MEQHKESRTRQTIAIVLQAELIRLHMKIKEHNDSLAADAEKVSKEINSEEALKYNPISVDNDFIIYKSSIKDIGLFEKDTAYQIVCCYGNVLDFVKSQDKFLRGLPGIANSSLLGHEAKNLSAREMAVLQHINRVVPLLAGQSKALPFQV